MRWLVTGAGGQLATHAADLLVDAGDEVVAVSQHDLDITVEADVTRVVDDVRPDVVLNAAAYTAVDAAETDERTAAAVNDEGPRALAAAVERTGGRLLHVSTDYVFAGDASLPYEPTDLPGPRTAYGRTKLAGEIRVRALLPDRSHVVRTAWVYGGPGPNFVDTMRRLERERDTVDVVADQIGSPTWARDLAAGLVELGRSDVPGGTLHYVNGGQASWCDLAREVFRLAGADPDRVRPTDTASFPRPAPRPAWSVLSTASWTAAGLTAPRPWQDALAACFERA
ncbi:SDR family oxidoreductase [Jatrophihabitans fulvus]